MSNINQNKRLVLCGSHEGGIKAVVGLIESGYKFSALVCLTPEQAKKYNISGYYDYRSLAYELNIPIYIPKTYDLAVDEDIDFFKQGEFDLLIQAGWQRLFPDKVLSSLNIGALGLHGSSDLLPKGRGRSPMNWSLIEGRHRFLMHLFLIKAGVDDGDIIGVKDFDINTYDDIETLYFKYGLVYRDLLIEYLPSVLAGDLRVHPQKGKPSFYPKRSPEDGHIDWEEMDIWQIYNFVRGQTRPYPGAFADVDGCKIRIWRCRPFDSRIRFDGATYGEVVERFGDKLIINCRGGLLIIDEWSVYE